MSHLSDPLLPRRIVCLTEETTEWLYLLGQEARIAGISGYTVRPRRARQEKPRVSAFLSANIDKILALRPDCVFGFSDLQADIAAALIRAGVPVTVFNQRGVDDIFAVLYQVAAMVGQADAGLALLARWRSEHAAVAERAARLPRRPRVYFEEWDEPPISAIRWVSELMALAGGDDVFPELACQPMGKQRILADASEVVRRAPDIVPRVQEIVLMGGGCFEGGNITPAAEFNCYVDPHAAAVVFASGVPITLVPLDCTHQALTSPARIAAIRALGGRIGPAVAGWLAFAERFDEQGVFFSVRIDKVALARLRASLKSSSNGLLSSATSEEE